eukprot:3542937-Rhodomonas_salina.2
MLLHLSHFKASSLATRSITPEIWSTARCRLETSASFVRIFIRRGLTADMPVQKTPQSTTARSRGAVSSSYHSACCEKPSFAIQNMNPSPSQNCSWRVCTIVLFVGSAGINTIVNSVL